MGSKYSGETQVMKKRKRKKGILPSKFGVGRSHFKQSHNEERERSNE